MLNRFKHKNFWSIFFFDILFLISVFILSNLIRFEFNTPPQNDLEASKHIFPYLIFIKIICFFIFDLYSGMWRFASIRDLINIIKASFVSFVLTVLLFFVIYRLDGLSRGVIFIDLLLTIIAIGASRLSVRFYFEYIDKHSITQKIEQKKLLIIGAGEAGEKLYREIKNNSALNYRVVGFIDDNKNKIGQKIHGLPVLCAISELNKAIAKTEAEEVIIAMPSVSDAEKIKKIVRICKENKVEYKTLPSTLDILSSDVKFSSLRKVSYEDLLGRDEIKLDSKKIEDILNNKNILITGAGGSIGSELCKQICQFKPKRVILFEIAETPLYEIDMFLRNNFPHIKIVPIAGDIKDREHIEIVLKRYQVEILFHAAAYKHVPMMEMQPWKAVENNVLGTKVLLEASLKFEIEKFILVSTDKAVNPTSVMGATKRVAEIMLQNKSNKKQKTQYLAVRFGNVLGSSGSVIPLFEKQIKKGGPVTVTHPDITRYFMTIPEACLLIIQATSIGRGGEIFILDMGEPVKITHLAEEMIKFYTTPYKKEVEITFTGLREGEKLYEELYSNKEKLSSTSHKKIMIAKTEVTGDENRKICDLIKISKTQNSLLVKEKIQEIVKEYSPYN